MVCPGMVGCSQKVYIRGTVRALAAKYDVIVMNYRGYGGMDLKSPLAFDAASGQDFYEVIQHVVSNYTRPYNKKFFVTAFSLGGVNMT